MKFLPPDIIKEIKNENRKNIFSNFPDWDRIQTYALARVFDTAYNFINGNCYAIFSGRILFFLR